MLSVIVTTKNEAANIAACLRSFDGFDVERIVVDNGSTDDTKKIAAELGAIVLDKGPERSAQRNLGWRTAKNDWVVILDADMILPRETVEEIVKISEEVRGKSEEISEEVRGKSEEISEEVRGKSEELRSGDYINKNETSATLHSSLFTLHSPLAYWIPEVRTGTGFRVRARNFERSFYDGTCIDALRLFHKSVLEATGGYDENLIAGPEDWELDIRILATGAKCEVLKHNLIHNEKQLSFKRMLEKKAYYSKSMAAYRAKWPDHPAVKKQFSPYYRFFGVFVEKGKWKKILRHPILFCGVLFERFSVGVTYLLNR